MRQRKHRLAEMNVVPYIDVMLVLLIIFMITSPLLTQGVDVELPTITQGRDVAPKDKQKVITINAKGELFVGSATQSLSPLELFSRMSTLIKQVPETEILIRGDQQLPYGEIVKVMGLLREAGVQKVGLLIKPTPRVYQTIVNP